MSCGWVEGTITKFQGGHSRRPLIVKLRLSTRSTRAVRRSGSSALEKNHTNLANALFCSVRVSVLSPWLTATSRHCHRQAWPRHLGQLCGFPACSNSLQRGPTPHLSSADTAWRKLPPHHVPSPQPLDHSRNHPQTPNPHAKHPRSTLPMSTATSPTTKPRATATPSLTPTTTASYKPASTKP